MKNKYSKSKYGIRAGAAIIFIVLGLLCGHGYSQTITFNIEYNSNIGPLKPFREVNIGPDLSKAGYGSMGIREVRTHDYYGPCDYWHYTNGYYNPATSSFNPSFNPALSGSYTWITSDTMINRIFDVNAIPYFRLGISFPQSGIPTIPPIDPNNSTFTTIASIFKHTAMHYTAGWDNGYTHNIIYWEIWNEPDGMFWTGSNGTPINYRKMYKTVTDSLKLLNPEFKVGGPGAVASTIVTHNPAYFDNFIKYCQVNDAALDFYSWHLYGCYNPYSIKNYADTVRYVLDSYGFQDAENHITEINPQLGNPLFDNTAKGAAHIASMLITGQEAPIDKIFWYRGTGLAKLAFPDQLGEPRLTFNGLSYQLFNWQESETTIKMRSSGNQVVNFNFNRDTTNVMALASKSVTGDTIDVLISNYNSIFSDIEIHIHNTPWLSSDQIKIDQYSISGQPASFISSEKNIPGSSNLTILVEDMPSPSVHLLRIHKQNDVGIQSFQNNNPLLSVFPNPTQNYLIIISTIDADGIISDASLKHVKRITLKTGENRINISQLPAGLYHVKVRNVLRKFMIF